MKLQNIIEKRIEMLKQERDVTLAKLNAVLGAIETLETTLAEYEQNKDNKSDLKEGEKNEDTES